MRRRGFISSLTTSALLTLALVACIVRGALPPGFMFEAGRRAGEIVVALCSEHGPAQALDLATGKLRPAKGDTSESTADPPCVFAVAAIATPSAQDTSLAAPVLAETGMRDKRVASVAIGRGLAAPPPPATGPPLNA